MMLANAVDGKSYGHILNVLKGTRHAGCGLALKLAKLTGTKYDIWLRGANDAENTANIEARKSAFLELKLTTLLNKQ